MASFVISFIAVQMGKLVNTKINEPAICVEFESHSPHQKVKLFYYCLYSADFAVCESYFDSVGVSWAVGEDVLDCALG
jgi:hypothetical protein